MNRYILNIYGVQKNNNWLVAGINGIGKNKVIIDSNFTKNKCLNTLIRFCWLSRLDLFFKILPIRQLLYKIMFSVSNKKKVLIFCNARYISQDRYLYDWIKKNSPESIIIIWMLNPLSKYKNPQNILKNYKKSCDFLAIYDERESQIFKINYLPLTYSLIKPCLEKKSFQYDVVFLGKAKDRLNLIMESYFYFKNKGLKVKYLLVGVSKKNKIKANDISYIKSMPYEKYLDYINDSKIILEIIQHETTSYTARALEASFYKRKLITNAKNIYKQDFINKEETFYFNKINEINNFFIKDEINYSSFKTDLISSVKSENLINKINTFIKKN